MSLFSEKTKKPSVCLVHDWLITMRGGEKVLEGIAELFPEAPIYTLFLDRKKLSGALQSRKIHTSFLQYIPGISKFYRWLLPLFPIAIWFLNVRKFDIVISSSHCMAKAIPVRKEALHICYCHTPMRYLWGFEEEYFGKFIKPIRFLIQFYFNWLRAWDQKTSKKVSLFIANSRNTANKILELYGKPSVVIHPPVDIPYGADYHHEYKQVNYFLIVSALVPYKKVDIAISAFNELRLPLRIVGDGPERTRLEKLVRHSEIVFDGWLTEELLRTRYRNCKALIFPGEEDFGIVPVEAQSFGKPVIAYGKGGVCESVLACNEQNVQRLPQKSTGIFFYDQTANALIQSIKESECLDFDSHFIQNHAQSFGLKKFRAEIIGFLNAHSIQITDSIGL